MNAGPESPGGPPPRDIGSRVINAARLDRSTFIDVKDDLGATGPAAAVVVLAALASAIGALDEPRDAVTNFILVVSAWLIYSHVAWFMRSYLFDTVLTDATRPAMMRVVGFAYGPALLRVFAIIPGIGELIWFAATVWLLMALVSGLRSTLAFSNYWPAVGIVIVGVLINSALSAIVFSVA